MRIPKKYYGSIEINRTSFDSNIPSNEKLVSCGLVTKTGQMEPQVNLTLNYYSGVYILDGTGYYVDKSNNKSYSVYPGCFIQRLPGVAFDTFINSDSDWLEFYLNLNEELFSALTNLKVLSNDPVLYIGEHYYLFDEFLEHMKQYNNKDTSDYPVLMFEVCKILFQINRLSNKLKKDIDIVGICNFLENHLNVGTNLNQIAASLDIGYEQLRKAFKSKSKMSMSAYIINRRIQCAKKMLLDNKNTIKEIAFNFNYCDEFAFINQFKKVTGMTPTQYKKQDFSNE